MQCSDVNPGGSDWNRRERAIHLLLSDSKAVKNFSDLKCSYSHYVIYYWATVAHVHSPLQQHPCHSTACGVSFLQTLVHCPETPLPRNFTRPFKPRFGPHGWGGKEKGEERETSWESRQEVRRLRRTAF